LRFRLYVAALLVAWSGSMLLAQKVTSAEELDKAMKKMQSSMQAIQKALKSESYEDARTQIATLKQVVDDSREFWVAHKKDDAIKANLDVVAKLEEADKLLATTPVDRAAVGAAMKQVGAACLACHKPYRVRDEKNDYIIKPGTIGN
jgi:cytochrome c556